MTLKNALIPSDEKIDFRHIPAREVPICELAEQGKTELVAVIIKPRAESAAEVTRELEQLSGPFGAILPGKVRRGELRLIDTPPNLRKMVRASEAARLSP